MVEKHVKIGNADWADFDAVALDMATPDFKNYVQMPSLLPVKAKTSVCCKDTGLKQLTPLGYVRSQSANFLLLA